MRAIVIAVALLAVAAPAAAQDGFEPSFTAGTRDAAGRLMGGTELRILVGHRGKLYAGNGYWMDQSESEGLQNAQILVLDRPGGPWRVEYAFGGRARNLAVTALAETSFATDGAGAPLAAPVSMLMAATWNLGGEQKIYTRDDSTGAWSAATLAIDGRVDGQLGQVRAFGQHRDSVTGVDMVFAGHNLRGIFNGVYDRAIPGGIRWSRAPEFSPGSIPEGEFPGLKAYPRVTSFAECNGRLYATVGQQIYARVDGANPRWRLFYTNSDPGYSESGLRGLTAVADP
ncbi:MAG: hypothetical protein ACLQJL_16550, partial [Roseiarcus sp.]